MNENERRLNRLTRALLSINKEAGNQFSERTMADGYEIDFYGEVKPFADRTKRIADEWKPLAARWVRSRQPKYIYPIQIKDTYDNLMIVSVTAFQKDTRRRRFIETVKAIDYVLENMLDRLGQDR